MNDLMLLENLVSQLDAQVLEEIRRAARLGEISADTPPDLLIEALLKIRSKSRGLVQFKLNHAQQEFSRRCTKRNIVLKARQLGMTTYVAGRFFAQTITQPGTLTVQVAHDQESAEQIFTIVHRFLANLPEEMQQSALMTSRANVRQIVFPRLDSEYRGATAADAEAGRGTTIHCLHCSEVARWPGLAAETLTSLRAAVPQEGMIVLESTPNGAGGVFYDEWQQAEETGYTKHFFPWWFDSAYRIEVDPTEVLPLTPEELALKKLASLDESQIAWRRLIRSQLRLLAKQEYAEDPVSCFRASGESVFDLEAIEQAAHMAQTPSLVRDNSRLMVWFPPQVGKDYIVGVDPAGGGSEGDYSCAEVVERETGLQCAELHGHFPPRELANKLIDLSAEFNHALLVVERNNHGHGVLANLRAMGCQNIFREGNQDGWLTSVVTRPAMIENLAAVLAERPGLFQSVRLLNECRTFVRQADGSTGAVTGAHDDCVMAMAIAWAARKSVTSQRRGS